MRSGDHVMVTSGPLPAGARACEPTGDGRWWLSVCVLGTWLPQMYRQSETAPLDKAGCAAAGLCGDCLGFGTLEWPFPGYTGRDGQPAPGWFMAYQPGEGPAPCAGCGGSGRPALRVTVTRDGGTVTGGIEVLPHDYVPDPDNGPAAGCMACGNPRAGEAHAGA